MKVQHLIVKVPGSVGWNCISPGKVMLRESLDLFWSVGWLLKAPSASFGAA
jgi:hypothetical protein